MKRIVKRARSAPPPPVPEPEPRLSSAERSELQRLGAKAAARGDPTDTNPLGQARNRPLSTGESADTWSQRSDAWDQGHEAQSAVGRDSEESGPRRNGDGHD